MAGASRAALLEDLREQVARIEHRLLTPGRAAAVRFGLPTLDEALPGGGIARGALHEVAGSGSDTEHGAAAALLTASILARANGPVLWVSAWFDLFAPALAEVGLGPERVLHVEAGRDVLAAMEEGLRHPALRASLARCQAASA
ncbi:ImuA family protein [Belnapia arida]|uniref:ImuA family protein n=1 Tax=Belnapia arida TaxID=2804533 RepID=UPI001F2ABAC7|nr:hypothetical protein [Belnapia arida]